MSASAHARRSHRPAWQVQRAGSGSPATDERAEAEAEEREERNRRAAAQSHSTGMESAAAGDDDGASDRTRALTRLARSGAAAPAAEVRALLASGDIDRTLVMSGSVEELLRQQQAAQARDHARSTEIAELERRIAFQLAPDDLDAQRGTWDPSQPRRWVERFAQGDGEQLREARRRLVELRLEASEEQRRSAQLGPELAAARRAVLARADERELQVLRLATQRLREHGGGGDADAIERLVEQARAEHRRITSTLEHDVARLDSERERIRADLGHTGAGGKVAAHAATEETLRRALEEAAAPLAAVRGRMAELTSQRDPRTRRRDRRLYARSSAKDLLERTLAQGHALRGAGGRGAQAIAQRGTTGQGAIDELLAGGLARTASLTDALRPGRARQLIGGEGPERRRRHDPETDGRSVRLPRRLRAQERRMARACDRAAAALVRHLRATPAPALLAELSVVETQLRERHAGLQRADRAYLARLAGAHHRTEEAAGRLPAARAAVAP